MGEQADEKITATTEGSVPDEDVVVWHTWSGRKHRFGPLQPAPARYDDPFRVALCNSAVVTNEHTQQVIEPDSECKRCFPVK